MGKLKITVFIIMICFKGICPCQAAEFSVATNQEIQSALDIAAHNGQDDTINIALGQYNPDKPLMFILDEKCSITIQGAGMGKTIVDGGGGMRAMTVDTSQASSDYGTTVTVRGMTLRNGYSDISGGGLDIKTKYAHTIVDDVAFINNQAWPPQAPADVWPLWEQGGGGGLFVVASVENTFSSVMVKNCLFKGNKSTTGAGACIWGMNSLKPEVEIVNNIFDSNKATENGGGLWTSVDYLWVINNTFVENESDLDGGGIFFRTGKINLYNNIVWGNGAKGQGGDIYISGSGPQSINIFNNTYSSIAFLKDETYSENHTSGKDPLVDENYELNFQSKCIDSGNLDIVLSEEDYKGNHRISGTSVDRGAIEHGSAPASSPNDENDPANETGNQVGGSGGGGCFMTILAMADTFNGIDKNSNAYKMAKRAAERHSSPEIKEMMEKQKQRLTPIVTKQKHETYRKVAALKTEANEKDQIMVFISNSMPLWLIRDFVKDSGKLKIDVQFILNGYPKNGINAFVSDIQGNAGQLNISIDPLTYDAYGVDTVPVVIINRTIKIDHPENLQDALRLADKKSEDDYSALIKKLNH